MKAVPAALYIMTALLILSLMAPILTQSQEVDLSVTVEPRDPCVAGYPCTVNVSVMNTNGMILIDYVKLITPWGAFTRNLGLRELRPNTTLIVPIIVDVDRNSLEGPNFVRPVVRFFKKGEVGLKLVEGNASSVMVIKPRINATLVVVPQSREITLGQPLSIQATYEVDGVPRDYRPTISVYLDGRLSIERELNGTSGEVGLSLPVEGEGNHTLIVSLCYGIGCTDRSFEINVRRTVRVISGYNKEELRAALKEVKDERRLLQSAYERTVEAGLPIPEDVLINISIIDSKIREAEVLLDRENISYADILRVKMLLNQSSTTISRLEEDLLSMYKDKIIEMISRAMGEVEEVKNINQTEYRAMKDLLANLTSSVDGLNLTSAPDLYSNLTQEISALEERIRVIKERAAEEARLLSGMTVSLIFVAMISGATIILRKWKSQLMKE
ncbi:MAG: hypothetical protein QI199_06785 [Candidatus Korarchaeota archaeon]|nr:hypothetical protein [Candidatus Korarchaeota archaeon]